MNYILLVSALLCATASAVADDSYFPIKTKTGGEGVTEFESKWYGQSLERMKEPRLPAPYYDPGETQTDGFPRFQRDQKTRATNLSDCCRKNPVLQCQLLRNSDPVNLKI